MNLQDHLCKLEQIVALVRAATVSLDCEEDGPDVAHILEVATAMLDSVIAELGAVALGR